MYYNIDNSFQIIYSSEQMQTDNMNIEYADFTLNYNDNQDEDEDEYEDEDENQNENENENENDTLEEAFHYEVEKAIENGNINFIKNAIICYGHLIDKSYIEWANSIAFQIVEEKMEDISL